MSIKYRSNNGIETTIAGLTPGGDIEAGAVAQRTGTFSLTSSATGWVYQTITFESPMPDDDYEVTLEMSSATGVTTCPFLINTKTANGFKIGIYFSSTSNSIGGVYTATKTYTVQHAAQNAEAIAEIQAAMPANAGSSNKLVTASDLSNVEIDKLEDINDVDVTGIQDGDTIIWDDTNSEWVPGQSGKTYTEGLGIDIDSNDKISVDQTYVPTTFVGSTAEWNALSAAEKAKYNLVSLNDDGNGTSVVDAVTNGEMRPVTSNAVYDYVTDNIVDGSMKPVSSNVIYDKFAAATPLNTNITLYFGVNCSQGIGITPILIPKTPLVKVVVDSVKIKRVTEQADSFIATTVQSSFNLGYFQSVTPLYQSAYLGLPIDLRIQFHYELA